MEPWLYRERTIGEKDVPPRAMKPEISSRGDSINLQSRARVDNHSVGGSRLRDTIHPTAQNVSERGAARSRTHGHVGNTYCDNLARSSAILALPRAIPRRWNTFTRALFATFET